MPLFCFAINFAPLIKAYTEIFILVIDYNLFNYTFAVHFGHQSMD